MYDSRKYVIVPVSEIHKINFDQVMEDSADTCRRSVDQTLTFVKYHGEMPPSVAAVEGKSKEHTHEEIVEILNGAAWTAVLEDME